MDTDVPDTSIPVQIEIFTERLLSPETVEELLTELAKIEGITRLILHGPRIASAVPEGPAKGTPNVHAAHKHIQVGGQDVELGVQVGRIWLELEDEDVIEQVEEVSKRTLPCGFQINRGLYMRTRPTQTDYAKWGVIRDTRVLGMTDPKSKSRICAIYPRER
ncbi:MAG TPA: methyl-coenzyme M reductase operon protein D [Candidatus Bathyarchaeia archaeon]|nr:methyl-coenzyme M reductase operon protein D [Candidatus Bathyarchaeia archaeon]